MMRGEDWIWVFHKSQQVKLEQHLQYMSGKNTFERSIHEPQNRQTKLCPHCRRQVPLTCHQCPQWSVGLRCCDEAVKSGKRLD